MKIKNQEVNNDYAIYHCDSILGIDNLPDNSVHMGIYSPPFPELYTYSDSIADLGNCKDFKEYNDSFDFVCNVMNKAIKPGRVVIIHCMDIPLLKSKHDIVGLYDWSGDIIKIMSDNGFIYHSRTTIWKDPVVEQQRTKAKGLLWKNLLKDSSDSRTGYPDYLLKFVKRGENETPIIHYQSENNEKANYVRRNKAGKFSIGGVELTKAELTNLVTLKWWQKAASPVWMDINQNDTLNNWRKAKGEKDVKHICPLQLQTINRSVRLWSNPGEVVMSAFGGIGSEGFESLKLFRKSISFELKSEYFELNKINHRNAIANEQLKMF